MAGNERVVNLVIRARDEYSRVTAAAKRSLDQLSAKQQLQRQVTLRQEMRELQATVQSLNADTTRYAKVMNDAARSEKLTAAEAREVRDAFVSVRDRAKEAKVALAAKTAELGRARNGAQGSFKAFMQNAEAMDVTATKADRLQRELAQTESAYLAAAAAAKRSQAAMQSGVGSGVAVGNGMVDSRFIASREQTALNQNARAAKDNLLRQRELRAELARMGVETQKATSGFLAFSKRADALAVETVQTAESLQTVAVASNTVETQQGQAATAIDKTTRAMKRQQAAAISGVTQVGVGRANRDTGGDLFDEATDSYATREGRGPLGLRPYELTNLSYQINDVVSGLAMGQPPMQIFAQQFGQIAQLFPTAMAGILRFLPVLGAFTVAIALPIARINNLNTSFEQFERRLALSADGAQYSASRLALMAQELDGMGLSLAVARDAIQAFVDAGVGEGKIKELTLIAKDLATATGMEVPDAIDKMAAAFTGGQAGVRELDKELNFLNATQYEQITALFEAGKETEAYAEVQRILESRLATVAKQAEGPWSRAWDALTSAFTRFLDYMGETWLIDATITAFTKLGEAVAYVAETLDSLGRDSPNAENPSLEADLAAATADEYREMVDAQKDYIAGLKQERDMQKQMGQETSSWDDRIAAAEEELAYLEKIGALTEEQRRSGAFDPYETSRPEKTAEEWAAQMNAVEEAHRKAAKYTQEEKKKRIDANKAVDDLLTKMEKENELASLTAKEQFIRQGIEESINAAKEKGVTLAEEELRIARERLGLIYEEQKVSSRTGELVNGSGLGSFTDRLIGIESGGNANAKNPNSTATGLGQFIESTWLSMFKKYFPDRAAGMTNAAILALRTESELSRQMIELYAAENAKVLQEAGVAVTDASLYLAHFLGPQGATKLLRAAPTTPVDQVLGSDQIAANQSILGGKTAGQVLEWAQRKMGISEQELAVRERLAELDQEQLERQKALADSNADMRFETEQALRAERDAAIQEALRNAEKTKGVALTKEERAEVEATAAALWDAENADRLRKEQGEAIEARVNALLERRKTLEAEIALARQTGDQTRLMAAEQELVQINEQLPTAIQQAIAFWQSVGGPEADAAIEKLRQMGIEVEANGQKMRGAAGFFEMTAEQINRGFADVGVSAFRALAQAIAEGTNAWQAFRDAALQSLANVILKIGEAIIQAAILNALTGGSGNISGGFGGFVTKLIAGVLHEGGIAGSGGRSRSVPMGAFAGAMRYHSGGIAGLKADEVPAILQRGEEVITEEDPRHRNNASGGGNTKIINAVDGTSFLEEALKKSDGDRVMLNYMRANRTTIRSALGV
jgi:hypothetical protein